MVAEYVASWETKRSSVSSVVHKEPLVYDEGSIGNRPVPGYDPWFAFVSVYCQSSTMANELEWCCFLLFKLQNPLKLLYKNLLTSDAG